MTQYKVPDARPPVQRRAGSRIGASWPVPVALLALTVIPLIGGSLRIVEITGGPHLLPTNVRIAASPVPLVLHVLGAAVYAVVGVFQFPARIRRRHRAWHRRAGRVLVGAGLVVAGSGLWMTVFYTGAPGGDLLVNVRIVVSCATVASIILGFAAIRRRDIAAHRAWMIRAYALTIAAGTQAFTEGIGESLFGTNDLTKALADTAAWVINLAVAEWIIRRPAAHRKRRAQAATPAS
jgi:uncharacterized membrane protein